MRRDFPLPEQDVVFLNLYGLPWETVRDGSLWVLVHDFPTHDGYNHREVSVAIRIESGYPQSALDMVYVYPALARRDNQPIRATEHTQLIDGKQWQRWSRHRSAQNPWIPGEDSIESHMYLIEDWFAREFGNA